MSRRNLPRALTMVAVATMVASVIGFVITLILNGFVFDEYDAYREVPIPGSSSLDLPAGEVTITFHTVIIGSTTGSGLPVPQMSINIVPPAGAPDPVLTEDIGSTTTVNNDARVRVWVAQIAAEGTYDVTTDGNVSAFLDPRLAFGRGSSYGQLPYVFVALFALAIVDLIIARVWAGRVRRSESAVGFQPSGDYLPHPAYTPPPSISTQPADPYVPTDQGIRIQQLDTLARLRDSGALTESEYETEKKRVLDGL